MQNDQFNPNQVPQDQPIAPQQPEPQPQVQFQQPGSTIPQPLEQQSFAQAPMSQQFVGVAPQPILAASGVSKKSKLPLIITLSVVGILIVAGAIFIPTLMNSEKNTQTGTGSGPAAETSSEGEGSSTSAGGNAASTEIDLIKRLAGKAHGVVSAKVAAAKGEPKRVVVTAEAESSPVSRTTFHAVLAATLNGAYKGAFTTATIEFVKPSGEPDETAGVDKAIAAEKGDKAALIGTPTSSAVTFNIRELRLSME